MTMQSVCGMLIVAALVCVIAGVYVLAGPGWALIVAGEALAFLAWAILRGLRGTPLPSVNHAPSD